MPQAVPADPPAPRRTTPAGLAGLAGLFAGACAIFALFVTVFEWRGESAQARWPLASALVERGEIDTHRAGSGGRSIYWQLRYRVRYEVDGQERTATLSSHSTPSDDEAARMRAWATQHRRGGRLDIRYDPAHPEHAVFGADVPGAGPRTSSNLTLTLVAAVACVLLLSLAKHMAAREPPDAGSRELTPQGRMAVGLLCGAMGLSAIGIGVHSALHAAHGLTSADFIFAPAALIFVFGGVLIALPSRDDALHRLFSVLLVTAFALTLDWIAFGPGDRRFSGGISVGVGLGFNPGEAFGRAAFGVAAVLVDLWGAALWVSVVRRRNA